jgi:hypothetical protein
MKTVRLVPIAFTSHGVFSEFHLPSGKVLFAAEDEWQRNASGKSCIPCGRYICTPRRYNEGGYDAYHITGVVGRDLILIHKGNNEDDTRGCILLGNVFPAWVKSKNSAEAKLAVGDSAGAFALFMQEMNGETFELVVECGVAVKRCMEPHEAPPVTPQPPVVVAPPTPPKEAPMSEVAKQEAPKSKPKPQPTAGAQSTEFQWFARPTVIAGALVMGAGFLGMTGIVPVLVPFGQVLFEAGKEMMADTTVAYAGLRSLVKIVDVVGTHAAAKKGEKVSAKNLLDGITQ